MRTLIASVPKRFNFNRFVARLVVAQLTAIAVVSVPFVIFGLIFTLTYGSINGFTEAFTEAYNFLKSLWNHGLANCWQLKAMISCLSGSGPDAKPVTVNKHSNYNWQSINLLDKTMNLLDKIN